MPKPTCARHMRGISRLAGDGSRCFPRPFALSDCSVPTRHILPDLNWDFKLFSQNLATHTRSDAADKLRHPSMLCRQQGMVTPALHNKVIAATSSSAVFWLLSADTHILGHFCRICTATRSQRRAAQSSFIVKERIQHLRRPTKKTNEDEKTP